MASQVRALSTTASYVALPDLKASHVSILNNTAGNLLVRMASEDTATYEITLEDTQSVTLQVNNNAKEVMIKAAGVAAGVQVVID